MSSRTRLSAETRRNIRSQLLYGRLLQAAENDRLFGRDGVGALYAQVRAEGVQPNTDDWNDRITEGLNALYPLN